MYSVSRWLDILLANTRASVQPANLVGFLISLALGRVRHFLQMVATLHLQWAMIACSVWKPACLDCGQPASCVWVPAELDFCQGRQKPARNELPSGNNLRHPFVACLSSSAPQLVLSALRILCVTSHPQTTFSTTLSKLVGIFYKFVLFLAACAARWITFSWMATV